MTCKNNTEVVGMQGTIADKRSMGRIRRQITLEAKGGYKCRKRFCEAALRQDDDLVNGAMYKKKFPKEFWTYT